MTPKTDSSRQALATSRCGAPLWFLPSAGPDIGFGHLQRCTVLARLLSPRFRPVFLAFSDDPWTPAWAQRESWQCLSLGAALTSLSTGRPAGIIIDTRRDIAAKWLLAELTRLGIPSVSVHDLGLSLLDSRVVVDGSIAPAPKEMVHSRCEYLCGPDYLVIDPSFAEAFKGRKRVGGPIETVFVGLGGGCRRDFLVRVLEGIRLWEEKPRVSVLPGFAGRGSSREGIAIELAEGCRWVGSNESVAEVMSRSDVAITAGGLTAYEALAVGSPVMALSYDEYQGRAVGVLASRGLCVDLGPGALLAPAAVAGALAQLNADSDRRTAMAGRGRNAVDGLGAQRVAAAVCSLIAGNRRTGTAEIAADEGAALRP